MPQHLAAVIGIERVDDARFLPRKNHLLAVGQSAQDGRAAEVVIRTGGFGTVADSRLAAAHKEVVFWSDLIRPLEFSGLHIERHDRVRVKRRNVCIRVAGSDVDQLALQIKRWSRPDRSARGTIHLCSGGVLFERLWFILDREALPDDSSSVSVERDDAAAELAALISCVASGGFFKRGNRNVDSIPIKHRRTGDAGQQMNLDLCLPKQLAGRGFDNYCNPREATDQAISSGEATCVGALTRRELGDE